MIWNSFIYFSFCIKKKFNFKCLSFDLHWLVRVFIFFYCFFDERQVTDETCKKINDTHLILCDLWLHRNVYFLVDYFSKRTIYVSKAQEWSFRSHINDDVLNWQLKWSVKHLWQFFFVCFFYLRFYLECVMIKIYKNNWFVIWW